jgi:hypothetical protein
VKNNHGPALNRQCRPGYVLRSLWCSG